MGGAQKIGGEQGFPFSPRRDAPGKPAQVSCRERTRRYRTRGSLPKWPSGANKVEGECYSATGEQDWAPFPTPPQATNVLLECGATPLLLSSSPLLFKMKRKRHG